MSFVVVLLATVSFVIFEDQLVRILVVSSLCAVNNSLQVIKILDI